jgi:hypothetical protein
MDPGIGGGGRLLRFDPTTGEAGDDSSSRGDIGGERVGKVGDCGPCGRGGGGREIVVLSVRFSLAVPESSSSDADPSVGDCRFVGGGGGGRAILAISVCRKQA